MKSILLSAFLLFFVFNVRGDCDNIETWPVSTTAGNLNEMSYREFPAEYTFRRACRDNEFEFNDIPGYKCNVDNVPIYRLPKCGVPLDEELEAKIVDTTLSISWRDPIRLVAISSFTNFSGDSIPVTHYNELSSNGLNGYAINHENHSHTNYIQFSVNQQPINHLTAEFNPDFCSSEVECMERFDINSISIYHMPCGHQSKLYVNVSVGVIFHEGLFAFKTQNITKWTFSNESCDSLKCTDMGIDTEPKFDPDLIENRAVNGTVAACVGQNATAMITCADGYWLGTIHQRPFECSG